MSTDPDPSTGARRLSDPAFFGCVALVFVLVVGTAGFFILHHGKAAPAADGSRVAVETSPGSARESGASEGGASEGGASEGGASETGATEDGAVAIVRKNFRLAGADKAEQSCALESPAYLAFDAAHYPQGSCAAASHAVAQSLAAQGLSLRVTSMKSVSFGADKATILVDFVVGSKAASERVFTQYRAGQWWITGDGSSGDLGF